MENTDESSLLQPNRYLIRVVTQQDKQEIFKLYIDHFSMKSPLRAAMFLKFPEKKHHHDEYWNIVKEHYTEQLFGKGMCVACVDRESNQIVGAIMVKDFAFSRQDLMKENQFIVAFKEVRKELDKVMIPQALTLFKQGRHAILQHWLYVMKQGHSGKGLMRKMAAMCDELAREKGYYYSASWASNFKTHMIFKKLGYENVAEIDARPIQVNGVKYFDGLEEQQKTSIMWLKEIGKVEKEAQNN